MLHPVPEPVQQTLLNGNDPLRRPGGSRESHAETNDQYDGEGETTIRIAGHGNPPPPRVHRSPHGSVPAEVLRLQKFRLRDRKISGTACGINIANKKTNYP